SMEAKLTELEQARQSGNSAEVHLTSDELAAFVAQSNPDMAARTVTEPQAPTEPEPKVQTLQVAMQGDEIIGQFVVNRMGKDIYVTMAGRLEGKDGYATLHPTLVKVGDLTVPISWVDDALQKKLAEPENREKLKLPPYVSSIRVENGELVIE